MKSQLPGISYQTKNKEAIWERNLRLCSVCGASTSRSRVSVNRNLKLAVIRPFPPDQHVPRQAVTATLGDVIRSGPFLQTVSWELPGKYPIRRRGQRLTILPHSRPLGLITDAGRTPSRANRAVPGHLLLHSGKAEGRVAQFPSPVLLQSKTTGIKNIFASVTKMAIRPPPLAIPFLCQQ